ncbi:MAG: LysR family transcriptional regulator [Paracoccus sp. (in: a-proteobacteria)]|uniref:winged helix-turn-helix domain-containing protein n=1 Tax=Paracoccus sp. TaxID=267 RepID=UPI0026DEB49F|nr:LysR family transcriptional regulator [Paracoccus sp. (in: a-proteobacteria)]MDO5612661.1 LysR family transcriptional regulator [Paracoccus sp. (in: a-proteobacteria)]
MTEPADNPQKPALPRIKLRLDYGPALTLGPGKADLLTGIAELGSISAAGRRMGMSYKRAWSLVEEMNSAFARPLVDSARGGPGGGGAVLTETGAQVLAHFRALESLLVGAGSGDIAAITGMLDDMSERK